MSKRDYYEVLGVPKDADDAALKTAYRRLARQHHPDVNKQADAGEAFKEVNEAYEVLSNPEKRQLYDRYGHDAGQGMGPGGAGSPFGGFGDISDIFGEFFGGFGGGRTAQRGPLRGNDLRYDMELTFQEAVFGVEKEIEVSRLEPCPQCNGSGAEPGTSPVRCPQCNGTGEVRRAQQTILGQFVNVTTCPRCNGEREIVNTPCTVCHGQKRVPHERKLSITIPAGVDDGTRIRLAGEGEPGQRGGTAGSLYVLLQVKPHPIFRREENDILLDLPVNIVQAALGAEIEVPTLEKPIKITIQAGTQTGEVVRLRGKGVPILHSSRRGDLLCHVRVVVPEKLTEKQRQLLRELGENLGIESLGKDNRGLFERIPGRFGRRFQRISMDWIEISVEVDGEAAEAVTELFNRLNRRPDGQGGAVTEVSGFDAVGEAHDLKVTVRTYLPADEPETPALRRQIEHGLWFLGTLYPVPDPAVRVLAEEDWANAWKAHYAPVRVGRHFLIIPAWQQADVRPRPDQQPIVLDPGMAFGTGLHPSTQLCLIALEDLPVAGRRVLDAGCGSGVLSIAAARLGAARVDAFDVDPMAVRATRENAALNGLTSAVHVFASSGPDRSARWTGAGRAGAAPPEPPCWDVILVNILLPVIVTLLGRGLAGYLAPGGEIVLAGVIATQQDTLREELAKHSLVEATTRRQGDWVSVSARRAG